MPELRPDRRGGHLLPGLRRQHNGQCPHAALPRPVEESPTPRTGQVFSTTPFVQVARGRAYDNLRLHPHQQGPGAGSPGTNPETQRRDLIEAGVPERNIHGDIDVSGAAGVASRNGWRLVDAKLNHGDTLN